MEYQYDQAVEILRRTPATLTAFLRGLPDAWTRSTEGENTWSAYDIVGHMLHTDDDWLARAHIILEQGDARPFDSVDRTAMFEKYRGFTLEQLLAAFEQSRAEHLAALDALHITPEQLASKGQHPALGPVTLGNLLASWVVHDLNHIGQIVEVMSRQYAEAVGPWQRYLNILTRPILTD